MSAKVESLDICCLYYLYLQSADLSLFRRVLLRLVALYRKFFNQLNKDFDFSKIHLKGDVIASKQSFSTVLLDAGSMCLTNTDRSTLILLKQHESTLILLINL